MLTYKLDILNKTDILIHLINIRQIENIINNRNNGRFIYIDNILRVNENNQQIIINVNFNTAFEQLENIVKNDR